MNAAMGSKRCMICRKDLPVPATRIYNDDVSVQCPTCGTYHIPEDAWLLLVNEGGALEKRYLLSGRSKMQPVLWGDAYRFDAAVVRDMKEGRLRDKPVSEKLELAMHWIEQAPPGVINGVDPATTYTAAYCANGHEFDYLLRQLEEMGLLSLIKGQSVAAAIVTAKGWLWLEERTKGGIGAQAFIAMSFAPDMKAAEDAIRAGVEAAGYEPVLVKDREFEDGVVDKILAEIRRSRFVIADFTHNRGGVYYEAGFALGMGLRVIGSCEKSHLDIEDVSKRLHFDVRHLNMIDWTADNLPYLTERVERRIRAMFGAGPKATAG